MPEAKNSSVKEVHIQLVKAADEYKAIDLTSNEVVERGLSQRELITKVVSKFKKQRGTGDEFKVYFLNALSKIILSRMFRNRKYSRFKKSEGKI